MALTTGHVGCDDDGNFTGSGLALAIGLVFRQSVVTMIEQAKEQLPELPSLTLTYPSTLAYLRVLAVQATGLAAAIVGELTANAVVTVAGVDPGVATVTGTIS